MPKLVTFENLLPPTGLTATATSGGTLSTGTYYYVVQACFDTSTSPLSTLGRSQSSNSASVTLTSGIQSVALSWSASSGAGGYRIYRATGSDGYEQMLDVAVRAAVSCSGGICSITDTGFGNPGNSAYQNVARGRLTLSGSTSLDPFSITDLYSASLSGSWGVVESLDESTYMVRSYLVGHTDLYWVDIDKTIVFRETINPGSNSNYRFGEKTASGITRRGCRLIFKTPDLSTISFPTLFAYKTTFDFVGTFNSIRPYTNISTQTITYSSGSVEYCLSNKMRGFQPLSLISCSISDTTITEADVALGSGLARISNVVGMANSRVFQTTNNSNITGSNIRFVGNTFGSLLIGTNFLVSYVNSGNLSSTDGIQGATVQGESRDMFTYDLKVLDLNNNPISGSTVELYNSSSALLFSVTTNSTGSIPTQTIPLFRRVIVSGSGSPISQSPHRLLITKQGYNTYEEYNTFTVSEAVKKVVTLNNKSNITINLG
jgi:hypothetical protein